MAVKTYDIKSITELTDKYGTKKQIEFADGKTTKVGIKNKAYKYINVGFVGKADIEWAKSKTKDGKDFFYIAKFSAGNGSTTQTPQKLHQQAKNSFKCDPDKLSQEEWKRRHTSWIGCLQCAVSLLKTDSEALDTHIIKYANKFYDALCEKVGEKPADLKSNDINSDIHRNTGPKGPNIKPNPQAEALAEAVNPASEQSDVVETDIEDIPF